MGHPFHIVCLNQEAADTMNNDVEFSVVGVNEAIFGAHPIILLACTDRAQCLIKYEDLEEEKGEMNPLHNAADILTHMAFKADLWDRNTRPFWLPSIMEFQELKTLERRLQSFTRHYETLRLSGIYTVVLLAPQEYCKRIMSALHLLSSAPEALLSFREMSSQLRERGTINIYKELNPQLDILTSGAYGKIRLLKQLSDNFSKLGKPICLHPTDGESNISNIQKILQQDQVSNIQVSSSNHGQSADLEEAFYEALRRVYFALHTAQITYHGNRLIILAKKSARCNLLKMDNFEPHRQLRPTFPVMAELTVVIYLDTAVGEPIILLSGECCLFPRLFHDLKEVLFHDVNVSSVQVWQAIFPELDDKDWQGQIFGQSGYNCRLIRKACRKHAPLSNAILTWNPWFHAKRVFNGLRSMAGSHGI